MGACCVRSTGIIHTPGGKLTPKDLNGVQQNIDDRYAVDPTRPSSSNGRKVVSIQAVQVLINDGKKIVKALYDYTAMPAKSGEIPDLTFKKDDLMEVTNEDGDWWLARCLQTDVEGYVPRTYVAPYSGLMSHDWFHVNATKKDVDKLLTTQSNNPGTFLVRESETRPGTYALSVLDANRAVKHYRINNMDDGGCFVTARKTFKSIDEMIDFYRKSSDGLCCKLETPCPRAKPQMYDLSRETRDNWEIPREELELTKQLGSGNFGEVWEGMWKGAIGVAVKTMKPGTMSSEKFLEEAEVMKTLRHPRLVALFAVCTLEEPIYIVTELMGGGSLLHYLRSSHTNHDVIPTDRLIDFAGQIADGMRFIEKENHIHRDLAARNILVSDDYHNVKIGDFGLSRVIEEEFYTMSTGAKFPVKWTSLEAIEFNMFTIKSDVWAFGILLVELTNHGATPYPGMNNQEVVSRLSAGYRHPQPVDCPDALYQLMLSCWHKDPQQRPTFEHLFLTLDDFSVSVEEGYKEPTVS